MPMSELVCYKELGIGTESFGFFCVYGFRTILFPEQRSGR